jgi:hypothetical protein
MRMSVRLVCVRVRFRLVGMLVAGGGHRPITGADDRNANERAVPVGRTDKRPPHGKAHGVAGGVWKPPCGSARYGNDAS